ncbi:MAG: PAS-domain containing protein, partial [Asticcacaulis sp.]
PIYLGPILVFLFGHRFIFRLTEAVKADGANSVSEFIGGRFGNSQGVAALVTLLALLGSLPYIALQLRSLGSTYALLTGTETLNEAMMVAAMGLGLFAMIYGTRRYEAAGRNDAVLFAVGFESMLKLGGLILAGVLAVTVLWSAPPTVSLAGLTALSARFTPNAFGPEFLVITLLSMCAIICLPRQFFVTVIEARSGTDILRARWPFIGYMLTTLLVVLPIAAAGLAVLPQPIRPDLYVLKLPMTLGMSMVATLVFLGGFSAATAMVIVETLALATMVSNDLIAPFLVRGRRFSGEGETGKALLVVRRGVIGLIMVAALGWAFGLSDQQRLSAIGLVAFAAMAQFAPALILAVTGGNRDATAAKAGLATGLGVWVWTLALPQVAGQDSLAPLSGTLIDPHALLGWSGLSPIVHGTLWSLGLNLLVYGLVTMRRLQPSAIPALLSDGRPGVPLVSDIAGLKTLVARFVGPEVTQEAFAGLSDSSPIDRAETRKAERMIAGVVGRPSARVFMRSALYGSNLTHSEVTRLLEDTGQSLRFSKGLLAATLENIDPGVSVVDRDLNIVAWNRRYLELFAYPPGMVRVGAPVADLIRYNAERGECGPGEVEAHVEKRLGHMRRGQVHSFERIRPDGRVLKTVGGPMPSGGYVMCFTDVTAEARALADLQATRAELESRVEQRTIELREANQALARADADKTRFLAAASHDLLQPLHAARLFSAALQRDLPDPSRPLLQKLDRAIESADALLRALLDISKLDAGGITPDILPVRMRPLLVSVAETLAPLAREKGLTLRVGLVEATVMTDAGLMRSIIQNFLSNAIRYTQQGGIVVGLRHRGADVRLDVIDTGPGIPPDKTALIFREFERLPNASEGGIGLGLAIVERTARLLGARISLESRLGHGSRFSLSLPKVSDALAPESQDQPKVRSSRQSLSILIIDDDPANCEAMESFVTRLGHRVSTRSDAANALVWKGQFDVALVDFNLGGTIDGLTVIDALRARRPLARYALVTAARLDDYQHRAARQNVTVFRKPVDTQEIEAWLDTRP